MRSREDLERHAAEICEDHVRANLRGEIICAPGEPRTEWDSFQLRQVFTQPLTIWRRASTFEVILDSAGRVAGFVDHEKHDRAAEGSLTPDEATALVAAIDVLPAGTRLIDLQAGRVPPDARIFRARFQLAYPLPEYAAVDVEINPTRREVISVRPVPRRR